MGLISRVSSRTYRKMKMSTPWKSENKPIQLGLCCLNITLRDQKPDIRSNRTTTVAKINSEGVKFLQDRILQNLADTIKLIQWNEEHGIKVLRVSSDLMPHK